MTPVSFTLRVPTTGGVVCVGGALSAGADGLGRFLPTKHALLLQRRAASRADVVVPVRQLGAGPAGEGLGGHLVDLSAGGFQVVGPFALRVGQRTRFRLVLSDGEPPLDVAVEVRRRTADGGWGVRMLDLAPAEAARLARLRVGRPAAGPAARRRPPAAGPPASVAPGEHVVIETLAASSHGAEVLGEEAGVLTLEWLDEPPAELGPVTLRLATARGLLCLGGALHAGADGRPRFIPMDEPLLIQRRQAVRVDLVVPVRELGTSRSEEESTGHLVDLSAGGFQLNGPFGLRVGQIARFRLMLPDDQPPLDVRVEVRRETAHGGWGVRMLGLTPAEEERLVRLVFARQRLALQRTRR